jgi:hypothetical protein
MCARLPVRRATCGARGVVANGEGFVSSTDYASSFDVLGSVSSDIDPETLTSAMSDGGCVALDRREYPLPNDKTLIRQDFRPGP